jgi:hypothetical protein
MNATLRALRLTLPVFGTFVPASHLAGQTIWVQAIMGTPRSSVRAARVTERVDGWWGGAAVGFRTGQWTVAAEGTRGSLSSAGGGLVLDRDVGEVSLSARYEFPLGLGPELRYVARAFRSAAGYQRWNLLAVALTGSRDLGTAAVRGFASVAYLPILSAAGGEPRPTRGMGSEVGLSVAPDRSPLALRVGYRVERFYFPQWAARSEQFETLTLSVGVRVRRHAGRWALTGGGKE